MSPFDPARVRAVIFDMDGLLLDSERIAYDIGRDICRDMGIAWRHEVAMQLIGRNSRDFERLLKHAFGEDFPVAEHQREFGRRYEAVIARGEIPLKPGVHALLDRLDERKLPRAVATSTRRSRALPKLEAVGLLARMNGVVGGDEVTQGKPAPDIFLAAAGLLGVAAADCLVFEDSNNGARGALAAGAQVIVIPDMLEPDEAVVRDGAVVMGSLEEARGWL